MTSIAASGINRHVNGNRAAPSYANLVVKPHFDRSTNTVQFGIARAAMKAFDFERFRQLLAAQGITRATFEHSRSRSEYGVEVITCSAELCEPMATMFVELAEKNAGKPLAIPAALAAKAALDVTA